MAKEALKKAIAKKQGGVDALTLKTLPDVPWKVDTDRIEQKAAGGTYTDVAAYHPHEAAWELPPKAGGPGASQGPGGSPDANSADTLEG